MIKKVDFTQGENVYMNKKKMAIVCDGKEIAYGTNLLHLHKYIDDKKSFASANAEYDVDIYSSAVFYRADISADSVKVFIGDIKKAGTSMKKIYCQWGITVWNSETELIVKADSKDLSGNSYIQFLEYANERRREYLEMEDEYVHKTEETDNKWIAREFKMIPDGGLFGQAGSMKSKLRQQYDCAAFVLYLDYLRKEQQ